jgi:hypothetical protein
VELVEDPSIQRTERYLLARRCSEPPYFVAVPVAGAFRDARTLVLDAEASARFAALPAGSNWALPLTPATSG